MPVVFIPVYSRKKKKRKEKGHELPISIFYINKSIDMLGDVRPINTYYIYKDK